MIYLKEFIICALASGFFAVLLSAPKRSILPSALLASVGYLVYELLYRGLGQEIYGFFLGTLAIALGAEVLARLMKMPSTVFTIPGIVPLVPGLGLYRTMLSIVDKDYSAAAQIGGTTLLIAGVMALGIALGSILARSVGRRKKRVFRKGAHENSR